MFAENGNPFRQPVSHWHPRSFLFEKSVSKTRAEEALKEGDEIRKIVRTRRILECKNLMAV